MTKLQSLVPPGGAPRAGQSKHNRFLAGVLAICAAAAFSTGCAAGAADDSSQRAMSRAKVFLDPEGRGKDILSYVHLGADYLSHNYARTTGVNDSRGNTIPGEFALVYRFRWKTTDNGFTDLAFLCRNNGNVYGVYVMDTDAVLNQPFLMANATIVVVGNALIAMFEEKLTSDDRRQLKRLVDDANAKGLLEWSLRFQQAFGG